MLRNKYDYDILIIGGGAAGVTAALSLARSGKRIALCDPGEPGGYEQRAGYGLRAPLLEAARLFSAIRESSDIGIRGGSVGYNFPTIREWSHGARQPDTAAGLLAAAGVTVHTAAARFISDHEVSLGRTRLTSAHFLICTGSNPIVPATIDGLADAGYLTPESAVDLLKPPKSLFIIGGGKTGVEFAGLFTSFGTTVSIAEISPRLLPDEDAVAGDAVARTIEARGGAVLTSSRLTSVHKDGSIYRITYLRGDVEHVVKTEAVLLAAGRAPMLDLGLENADVDYSPLGITVSSTLQTSVKHIYAAGSVAGTINNAEGARLEATHAANNLLHRDKSVPSYAPVPTVIFSQPQVASVGVNESDALRRDIAITTASVELADTVLGGASRENGSVTLVADRKGALIGATIIARDAAESINSLSVAIAAGTTIEDLAKIPLGYGTIGNAVTDAAAKLIAA